MAWGRQSSPLFVGCFFVFGMGWEAFSWAQTKASGEPKAQVPLTDVSSHETKNLANIHPDRLHELQGRMGAWRREQDAPIPSERNPL